MVNPLYSDDLRATELPQIRGYKGAFAVNLMPIPNSKIDRPFCFIVNDQVNGEIGNHWMAICFPPNAKSKIIFIEPIGMPIHKSNRWIKNYLKANASYFDLLPFGVQPCINSNSCGHFCAYILHKLQFYGYNIRKLSLQEFSPIDHLFNDRKVVHWWTKVRSKKYKKEGSKK